MVASLYHHLAVVAKKLEKLVAGFFVPSPGGCVKETGVLGAGFSVPSPGGGGAEETSVVGAGFSVPSSGGGLFS